MFNVCSLFSFSFSWVDNDRILLDDKHQYNIKNYSITTSVLLFITVDHEPSLVPSQYFLSTSMIKREFHMSVIFQDFAYFWICIKYFSVSRRKSFSLWTEDQSKRKKFHSIFEIVIQIYSFYKGGKYCGHSVEIIHSCT